MSQREHQLLREHDTIVLQFPVYWYNVTPILKAWFDAVLVHGFAFTFDGSASALSGKKAWLAVSVGSTHGYLRSGRHRPTVPRRVPRPGQQTLEFCQLDYQGVHAVYGMMFNPSDEDLILDAKEYHRLIATSETPVG